MKIDTVLRHLRKISEHAEEIDFTTPSEDKALREAAEIIEAFRAASRDVVTHWATGNLAEAVNALAEVAEIE